MLEESGEKPRLAVREIPLPTLGPRDVLVRVGACGLCYHDILVMEGKLRRGVKSSVVLGHEIAGMVMDIGAQVTSLSTGDMVVSILTDACGNCLRCHSGREHRCLEGKGIGHSVDGGMAEYVSVGEFSLVKLPQQGDPTHLCLLGCPIGVVFSAIAKVAKLEEGETVVVTGAGGGMGVHAVQVAKLMGAQVLAVTSSEEKVEGIRQLGADEVIETGELAFSEVVMALTEDRGAEVVIDTVGSPLFPATFHCLGSYGRMVALGEASGREVRLNLADIIFRDARILGSSGASRKDIEEAWDLVSEGKLKPVICQVLGLDEVLEGYQMMKRRQSFGRIVVQP